MLLIVPKGHALAELATVKLEQLVNETILTYPVPRHRLDIFNRILQPNNIEPRNHKQVEETDIMLQLVASNCGICLLPEWLLAEKSRDIALAGLRIKDQPLNKTMYLAMRPEDLELEYIKTFIRLSGNNAIA